MRVATTAALAVMTVGLLAAVRPAAAQLYGYGLSHSSLGQATISYDPALRRLPVGNIGSSGQDGVEIKLGSKSSGHAMEFPGPSDLDVAGATSAYEMRGVSGGIGTVVGRIDCVRNSDGSEDLSPDFSGVGATRCWVVLVDASGAVVKRINKPLPLSVHVSSAAFLSKKGYDYYMTKGKLYSWIKASYDHEVTISAGGGGGAGGTICVEARFICDTGTKVDEIDAARLTCAVPSGTGSFTLSQEGIVPPCAGCPNGPDDNGIGVALGDAHWALDGPSGDPPAMENIGSSGQDGVSIQLIRESPTKTSLGCVLDEQPLAPGTLSCEATGRIGGLEHSLGTLSCLVELDHSEFVPDFSAVGSGGYRVLLYLNGVVVADVTNPASHASHQKPQTQWLVQSDMIGGSGPAEFRIICITSPCPGWSVTLNGALYTVDQIVFQPVGAAVTAPDYMTSLALRASGGSAGLAPTLPIYEIRTGPAGPLVGVNGPSPTTELAARMSPNPAAGPMRLVFAMPLAGTANVAVIDAAGRKVRGLASGAFTAGAHELVWDGRDAAGRITAPGVYFVRVEAANATRVTRVTRLW